jgi:PA14 domain
MRANPSTLIIVVIMILLIVIYVDMNYNCCNSDVEHNTNLSEYIEDDSAISEDDSVMSEEDPDTKDSQDTQDSQDAQDSQDTQDSQDIQDTSIHIDMDAPPRESRAIDTEKLQIITAGLGPEVRRLGDVETKLSDMRLRQIMNTNLLEKLYKKDVLGDYMTRGWFVQVHDVISTPHGVSLGAEVDRFHGIRRICFRAQNNFPFLGIPQDPMYLPKSEFIGFRAMTIFKVPRTGYYNFRVLSDDGSRLMYQVVNSDVMIDEKNLRDTWTPLIDQWRFQAETWNYSQKLYFNQSDLVLLRFDYFQADANSTACIKVRYSEVKEDSQDDNRDNRIDQDKSYDDFSIGDLYCSLLWSHVPLMGTR